MGEKTNSYKVLVGNPEGEMSLGKPRRRWGDNNKARAAFVWLRIGTSGRLIR
jgi:hypothetical protein